MDSPRLDRCLPGIDVSTPSFAGGSPVVVYVDMESEALVESIVPVLELQYIHRIQIWDVPSTSTNRDLTVAYRPHQRQAEFHACPLKAVFPEKCHQFFFRDDSLDIANV